MQPRQVVARFIEKAKEYTEAKIETFAYLMAEDLDTSVINIVGLWFPVQTCKSDMVSCLPMS